MTLSAHFSLEEVTRSATAAAKGIDNEVLGPLIAVIAIHLL